jgi:hypothetical protein
MQVKLSFDCRTHVLRLAARQAANRSLKGNTLNVTNEIRKKTVEANAVLCCSRNTNLT